MEPMLLGSPGSPIGGAGLIHVGSASATSPSSAATFLPSYLLGDVQNSPVSRMSLPNVSPGTGRYPLMVSGGQSSPTSPLSSRDSQLNISSNKFGRSLLSCERPSGPPVLGLGSSPAAAPQTPSMQKRVQSPFPEHLRQARTPLGSPQTPHRFLTSSTLASREGALNSSIISTEVHGEVASSTSLTDEWVTVFGFPVASVSYILSQFAQLGTIADHRLPGSGNWMHLRYQTRLQAGKALALNGKVFSGNIMIGVVPCTDKTVICTSLETNKENHEVLSASMVSSPALRATNCGVGSDLASPLSTPKTNIRPLALAFSASTPSENSVLVGLNTPKKSDSFLSKAMQTILGV